VELLELKQAARSKAATAGGTVWENDLAEILPGTNWLVNEGLLRPTLDPVVGMEQKLASKDDTEKAGKGGAAAKGAAKKPEDEDEHDDHDESDTVPGLNGNSGDEGHLIGLLYHPTCLRTSVQKRRQMHFLNAMVEEMKKAFNRHFDEAFKHKESEMDRIEQKNDRISEIVTELGTEKEFLRPRWHAHETPSEVLRVTEEEMTKVPYETEAMRRKRKEQEEEKRRREEEAKKDDIGARALDDMMSGTLEVKRDTTALTQELVREEWMDELPYEEMSEEQKKLLEEFEEKQKGLIEEKEKHRKALELELKKLTTEIQDIARQFDERVEGLHDMYLHVSTAIATQELYIFRLARSVMQKSMAERYIQRISKKLVSLEAKKSTVSEMIADFGRIVEEFEDGLRALSTENRNLEQTFRKNITEQTGIPIDGDTSKLLLQLYKRRKPAGAGAMGRNSMNRASGTGSFARRTSYRRSSINAAKRKTLTTASFIARASYSKGKASGGGKESITQGVGGGIDRTSQGVGLSAVMGGVGGVGDKGNMITNAMNLALIESAKRTGAHDPYSKIDDELERKRERDAADAPTELDLEKDSPEGFMCEDIVWAKLNEMRVHKINKENELKKRTQTLNSYQAQLKLMQSEEAGLSNQIALLAKQKAHFEAEKTRHDTNLEVLVQLKQGQDEISQGSQQLASYQDGILVHRSVVEEKNAEIIKLGKEKVTTLTRIKNFRKNINYMLWEHKYLQERADNLEEHYTDLHMLRVTKSLQSFIKGGDTADQQKLDIEKAEAKLEHLKLSHQSRMRKIQLQCGKLSKAEKEKVEENDRLKGQISQLAQNVTMREQIYRSRFESGDGSDLSPAQQAQSRMRTITMRRKLIDLARAQTDEIEFLRQELDRLRQRTFPSFAHSNRRQLAAPDEIDYY